MKAKKRRVSERKGRLAPLFLVTIGLGVASLVVLLYLLQPALLQQLDRKIYDTLLTTRMGGEPSPLPIIVDIDEKSLEQFGQWPWPRYRIAQILGRLVDGEVAAVGLDILLSEVDRTSPLRMRENLSRDFGIDIGFIDLADDLQDNDALLADMLSVTPAVLGSYLLFDSATPASAALPVSPGVAEHVPAGALSPLEHMMEAKGMRAPLPVLTAVAPVGTINAAQDMDGLIRQVPLVSRIGERVYPNLSLRTLMRAQGRNTMILHSGPNGLEEIRIGAVSVPVTPAGMFPILFRGKEEGFPVYSAVDILEGRVDSSAFEGKIAFIGSSAAALVDIRATPFNPHYAGVRMHAAVVDAILSGRTIYVPPETPGFQVLLIFTVTLLSAFLFGRMAPPVYLALGGGLFGLTVWASYALFIGGVFLSPLYALLAIVATGLAVIFVRLWIEETRFRRLQKAFGRYVAPEVVARIAERGNDVFTGEEREVTILFTDIRGFTQLSEKLEPEQVVDLLNRYFTPMTAMVRNNDGTLDKFIGDALMAFWNAPLDVADHSRKAVETALEIHANLERLNDRIEKDFGVRLSMGAALHTGEVYVGNMGSKELLNYTIIGDNVNIASRLETLTAHYGLKTIISDETRRKCGDSFSFVRLDRLLVKGKSQPVDTYVPMRHEEYQTRREELDTFENGLTLYESGRFEEARELFSRLFALFPSEKLYSVFAERCINLAADPPADWRGVWTSEK